MAKDLEYYTAQLRRIEEHREQEAEKEIRKMYKDMMKDLQHFIADEYVQLAQDGKLTYEILHGKNRYAKFLEEVEQHLNGISPKVSKEIRQTVEEIYKLGYEGMVDAVAKSTTSQELREALKSVSGVSPEIIKAAVENPVSGLTLNDTLEKNRGRPFRFLHRNREHARKRYKRHAISQSLAHHERRKSSPERTV